MDIRNEIYQEIDSITPLDSLEIEHKEDALQWVKSGIEIFRIKKEATPPKHLVSYFVVVDGDYILLADHKKAQAWLPTGGHVEANEHPKTTVEREALEEIKLTAKFLSNHPLMITTRETVGLTAGHIDVSLWYAIKGDRKAEVKFDKREFNAVQWFHIDNIPFEKAEPNLKRFIAKLKS